MYNNNKVSGHGTQVIDTDWDELDGKDEGSSISALHPLLHCDTCDWVEDFLPALIACDGGYLIDDELHEILVKAIPAGCRLTVSFYKPITRLHSSGIERYKSVYLGLIWLLLFRNRSRYAMHRPPFFSSFFFRIKLNFIPSIRSPLQPIQTRANCLPRPR